MRAALLLLLGLPAFVVGTSTPSPDVGGKTNVNVTDENTQVLTTALTNGYYDDSVGDTRICYAEIESVETQVDAGEFFYFQVLGCQVTTSEGACSIETKQSCSLGQFEVIVFEIESTATPEVISITLTSSVTDAPVTDDPIPGGWYTIGVDAQLLTDALTSGNYASSVGETRICFSDVTAAEAQTVNGMNYRYNITGCDVTGSNSVGACSSDVLSTCTLAEYVVEFYQSFENDFEVTGITKVSSSTPDTATPVTYVPGGWYYVDVTDENTQVLANALSDGNYSDSVGSTRVCYHDVTAVEQQIVAGWNYHFYIDGCVVTESEGACSSDTLAACTLEEIVVDVFESWTNTLEVTGITIEGSSSKTAEPITATPSTTAPIPLPGGWTVGEVTEENTKLLSEALVDGNYSDSVGETRVCYAEVTEVETQVVAGINYRFHITGCDVTGSDLEGACSSDTLKTCTLEEYVVQVFEQSWTNTLEVTSITLVGSGSHSTTSEPVTATPSTTAPVTATPSTTAPVTATPASTAPVTSSPVVTSSPITTSPKTGSPKTTAPNGNSSGSDEERQAHQAC